MKDGSRAIAVAIFILLLFSINLFAQANNLLYLKNGNPVAWTTPGVSGSQSIEITHWQSAGFTVTPMDLSTTVITPALLTNYDALRITAGYYGGNITDAEGQAIYDWVNAGGKLLAEIIWRGSIPAVSRFGLQAINGLNGGPPPGAAWAFGGAPLLITPITGPAAVNTIASEAMDMPILNPGHTLTIDATLGGYPAVTHAAFGLGRVFLMLNSGWSHDLTYPGNAFRANITQQNNLQFLDKIISYLTAPPPPAPVLSAPAATISESICPPFSWQQVPSATGYNLQIFTDLSDPSGSLVFDNTTSLISITGGSYLLPFNFALANSNKYYWRMQTKTAAGNSSWSSSFSFTTILPAMPYLTMPSNGAELIGTTTTFAWYSTTQAINYTLEINTSADFSGTAIPGTTTSNTYFTVNNSLFTQGGLYFWRVISKTIEATPRIINISNVWQFRMPGLPQPIASSPTGNGTIYINPPTLYWYTLSYNPKVTGYRVKFSKLLAGIDVNIGAKELDHFVLQSHPVDNTAGYFSTNSINTSITIPVALDAGSKYYWQVASTDGSNESAYSPVESFTVYGNATFLACYPSYPTAGSSVYSTTPTFYWYTNLYAPVMYYKMEISDGVGTILVTKTGLPSSSYTLTSGEGTHITTPGTYYWHVAGSLDGVTYGSWSAPASFVVNSTTTAATVATPFLASPTAGTVINVTNPTLTWAAYSADPLLYKVTWSTNPAIDPLTGTFFVGTATSSAWISLSSFVLGSLTPGATYYWQVQAKVATTGTLGAWSSVGWFTLSAGAASVVPIAGSPINGTPINNTSATLSWVLPTQSTSTLKYELQYSKSADFSSGVSTVSNVEKANVDVKNLDKNALYYWRVASKTSSGDVSSYSAPTSFSTGSTKITGVEQTESLPTDFELSQNYPNPFNPTTIINYALPTNSYVTLKVYDMLGREVKTLVNSQVVAGRHSIEWRGDDNSGSKVATGVYIYRVTADNFVSSKKMLLIK